MFVILARYEVNVKCGYFEHIVYMFESNKERSSFPYSSNTNYMLMSLTQVSILLFRVTFKFCLAFSEYVFYCFS